MTLVTLLWYLPRRYQVVTLVVGIGRLPSSRFRISLTYVRTASAILVIATVVPSYFTDVMTQVLVVSTPAGTFRT